MRRFFLKLLVWSAVMVAVLVVGMLLTSSPTQMLSRLNGNARDALRAVDEWIVNRVQVQAQELETEIGLMEQEVRRVRAVYEATGSPESCREWKDLETVVLSLRLERAGLIGNQFRRERADQASTDRIRELLGYGRSRRTAAETASIADVAVWLDKLDGEGRRRLFAELSQREQGIRQTQESARGNP